MTGHALRSSKAIEVRARASVVQASLPARSGRHGGLPHYFCRIVATWLLCAIAAAHAQEGPAQWLARIFDPATLKIEPFPDGQLNRKLSTDAIAIERGGTKQIAVYTIPLDQLKAAADHFAAQLGMRAQVMGGGPSETQLFDCTAAGAPARCKGLRVLISRSPFVDNKGEIKLEYQPPPK